ncbi:uncharacterized protein LOC112170821 [Rosa chinensis]|uniref:uncharacterized protein LOC112170821 n=1 Tax=Rosa chinensis TaxID=74649 RepID=UPI000D08E839|nr:uncharacterized protein LOC112170821 [Rosa chinensis]
MNQLHTELLLKVEVLEPQVLEFEDNEDMFADNGSNQEQPDYIINYDGEQEEVGNEFNPKTDIKRPVFKLDMKFGTVQILRDALKEMAIQGGWEYVFIKNDKVRLRVICKEDDCPFELFASKMQHENSLMIKGYNPKHTYTRKFNNSMVKLRYLTAKFKDQIALNDAWKTNSLAKIMSAKIRARVSTQMAYKANRAALLEVEGALKNGIKAGFRSVIGLDGAHLKICFGGQLLTTVGTDANNTSWVVAYAMVEFESKDSWIWFLELLCKVLEIKEDGAGWVFLSDKQKGLKSAFEEVVLSAHIRFCVRHMWTNFTKLFPGKVMKDQMWKCAKSTILPYYLNDMEEMKALDEDAYK